MPRPRIGLTTCLFPLKENSNRFGASDNYVRAIVRAGGIPLMLPFGIPAEDISSLRSILNGFLMIGGPDINPDLYHGIPHPAVYGVNDDRDGQEVSMLKLAVETRLPILGICRGFQMMNVALGGSLYTDLAAQKPNALKHNDWADDYLAHSVRVEKGSRLSFILGGTDVPVNSMHHQGIKELASGLKTLAFAPDNLIEAVEVPNHPFALGVQWHPECLPENPAMQSLFSAFIEAAGKV